MIHVYPALIKRAEKNLSNSKGKKKIMMLNGVTYLDGVNLEIEENARILEIMTRSRREKQADLFEINVQLNHK